jgi:hypothetical protein
VWEYRAINELYLIDFHDCIIESIKIEDKKIIMYLESVNVLSNHKLT